VKRLEYTIRLLRAAEDDLTEIVNYIAADRPSAADALATKIENDINLLSKNPQLGRIPNEEELMRLGCRYLVVQNYLIFYTLEERVIYIHRILHGARDYLSLF
jgi:toxin ParE1/3/4